MRSHKAAQASKELPTGENLEYHTNIEDGIAGRERHMITHCRFSHSHVDVCVDVYDKAQGARRALHHEEAYA